VNWTGFDLSRLLVPGCRSIGLAYEKAWVPSVVGDVYSTVRRAIFKCLSSVFPYVT
jgi:hypothetical protein